MQTQPFGAQQRPDGVTEDEWRLFQFGAGRGMAFLMRVNASIFQLRLSGEMLQHYGTLEELLPLIATIPTASGWHPEMEPLVQKIPPKRSAAKHIAPSLENIDDLLSGL